MYALHRNSKSRPARQCRSHSAAVRRTLEPYVSEISSRSWLLYFPSVEPARGCRSQWTKHEVYIRGRLGSRPAGAEHSGPVEVPTARTKTTSSELSSRALMRRLSRLGGFRCSCGITHTLGSADHSHRSDQRDYRSLGPAAGCCAEWAAPGRHVL